MLNIWYICQTLKIHSIEKNQQASVDLNIKKYYTEDPASPWCHSFLNCNAVAKKHLQIRICVSLILSFRSVSPQYIVHHLSSCQPVEGLQRIKNIQLETVSSNFLFK